MGCPGAVAVISLVLSLPDYKIYKLVDNHDPSFHIKKDTIKAAVSYVVALSECVIKA